jgi:hypothetical protein
MLIILAYGAWLVGHQNVPNQNEGMPNIFKLCFGIKPIGRPNFGCHI